MIRVKMYPAKNGDAFLVDAAGTFILVDAGYASTFANHIAPDLAQLSHDGHHLALIVATHIDSDHIGGILEFVSVNGSESTRSVIDVKDVWHNSLRSISPSVDARITAADLPLLQSVQRMGFPSDTDPSVNPIGAKQGSSLARLLRERGYQWNRGDGTSCISNTSPPMHLANDVHVRVIGPPAKRLAALRDWWIKEMQRLGYRGGVQATDVCDDAYEMWCASKPSFTPAAVSPISASSSRTLRDAYVPDVSVQNGSSIALIIQVAGKSTLFLGDSWADDIFSELVPLRNAQHSIFFDAIKVSHHGSLHNTSEELLSLIDAPYFFVSSDSSRHGHPDIEVLKEIVDRPATFDRTIYFNYETEASRLLREHTSRSGSTFRVRIAGPDWICI